MARRRALLVLVMGLAACDDGRRPTGPDDVAPPEDRLESTLAAAVPDTALRAVIRVAVAAAAAQPSTAGLDSVTALSAGRAGVADLTGIGLLSRLRIADLTGNAIVDLAPVAGLDCLRVLDLSLNRVADVGPLARLPSLGWLTLDGNPVADLAPLLAVPRLQQVSLLGVVIGDSATVHALEGRGVEVGLDRPLPDDAAEAFDLAAVTVRAVAVGRDGTWYAGVSWAPLSLGLPLPGAQP